MSDSYVLELKLNTKKQSDRNYLENYFRDAWNYSNTLTRFAMRQLNRLKRDPAYRSLLRDYNSSSGDAKKRISLDLRTIVESYGLTKYGLQPMLLKKRKNSRYLHSDVAQKLSDAVWRGVEKCLYREGRCLHFNRYDESLSFENKKNTTGIIYDGGRVYINCTPKHPGGGIVLNVLLPKNQRSAHYRYETACLHDRTKYCRIVRKPFSGGWSYYVQLIQEGIPPQKHAIGTGRVGIDIGTSTVAAASDYACHLDTLGDSVATIEREARRLSRALDRSRRNSNPDNYHPDGRSKKGCRTWVFSNNYRRKKRKLSVLYRKRAAALKQAHERYANMLLSEGNAFYIEAMNFKGLQKRKIQTELRDNGRAKSKRRFGRSIGLRAPAQFVSILKRKAESSGGTFQEVNTRMFKASQYNHVTDTYEKKPLSRRCNEINGGWVQRDLYSAFLLKNSATDLKHADRTICTNTYEHFKTLHDQCIATIKETYKKQHRSMPSSFGIVA